MRHNIHTEILIEAPPSAVWEVLVDLKGYSDWNPLIPSAEGRVAVGERLINRLTPPGGKAMTFKPTITVVDVERTFEWLGRLFVPGLFDGRHRFELHRTEDGGTRLVHSEAFSGLLVRPLRSSLDTNTCRGFEAMNAGLKHRVETTNRVCG